MAPPPRDLAIGALKRVDSHRGISRPLSRIRLARSYTSQVPGVLPGAVLKQNWPDPQGQDDRVEVVRWLLLGEISLPVPSKLSGFPPGLFSHAGLGAEITVLVIRFELFCAELNCLNRRG